MYWVTRWSISAEKCKLYKKRTKWKCFYWKYSMWNQKVKSKKFTRWAWQQIGDDRRQSLETWRQTHGYQIWKRIIRLKKIASVTFYSVGYNRLIYIQFISSSLIFMYLTFKKERENGAKMCKEIMAVHFPNLVKTLTYWFRNHRESQVT